MKKLEKSERLNNNYSRNIWIIYAINFLKGLIFFLPIYALYLQSELFTLFNVTLILSVQAFARLLFEIPSGAVADLFGRKNTLIFSGALAILSIWILSIGGHIEIFIVYTIISALSEALLSGTDTAILFDSLKSVHQDKNFKKIISWNIGMWQIGATISSALGGFLAAISLKLPIYLTLIPFTIAFILTFIIIEPPYKKEAHKNIFNHMNNSFKILFKDKQLLLLGIITVLLFAFSETAHTFDPIFYTYKNISLQHIGIIASAGFILSFLGSIIASHYLNNTISDKKILYISTIMYAILLFLATLFIGFYVALAIILGSFFWGMRLPIITDMFNKNAQSKNRATLLSIVSFASLLGIVLFSPIFGRISDNYTINIAIRITAILSFMCVVLIFFMDDSYEKIRKK